MGETSRAVKRIEYVSAVSEQFLLNTTPTLVELLIGEFYQVERVRYLGRPGQRIVEDLAVGTREVEGGVGNVKAPVTGSTLNPGGRCFTISTSNDVEQLATAHVVLQVGDREVIMLALHDGLSMTAIALQLGRSLSTVTREVKANGGREDYRVWPAHQRARENSKRPKPSKLANPALCDQVTEWLEKFWSPEEISACLRLQFADDPAMHVSHETIYQSLFVQGRGELRRELARCLRSGRTKRRVRGPVETRGKIPNMVMISERPAEVEDRAVPGHWEGDLIIGKDGASAVGTLVERQTRLLLLLHLPDNHGAEAVEEAMRDAICSLPSELVRSVTWDQGSEMAKHAKFTVATGVPIYFCDPHSGSEEPMRIRTDCFANTCPRAPAYRSMRIPEFSNTQSGVFVHAVSQLVGA